MKVEFLGSNRAINGARTLLTMPNGLKILIDFGLAQSNLGKLGETMAWNGREFEFEVEDIDYLILTHGHIDHIGLVPLLYKRGFRGEVIATAPTAEFARVALPDSARIMEGECILANKRRPRNKLTPLYDEDEAKAVITEIKCYDYNTKIVLDNYTSVKLLKAGHMLGACMPKITYLKDYDKRTVVFTGDTSGQGGIQHPFLDEADDLGEVDYVICESTYGDRQHFKVDMAKQLADEVHDTCIQKGKTLLLPVFAMQRSSEILWYLREAYNDNPEFYKIPIYLDSPMAIEGQKVLDGNREYWGKEWIEEDNRLTSLFDWEVLNYIPNYQASLTLNNPHPKIILSSSGMCSGGRVLQHIENFLPHKDNKILFTGHQIEGLLGHRLLNSEQNSFSVNGNQVTRRADVGAIPYSSHADKFQLLELLKSSKKDSIKEIFLVHGDEEASLELQVLVRQHLKKAKVRVPRYSSMYKLR